MGEGGHISFQSGNTDIDWTKMALNVSLQENDDNIIIVEATVEAVVGTCTPSLGAQGIHRSVQNNQYLHVFPCLSLLSLLWLTVRDLKPAAVL